MRLSYEEGSSEIEEADFCLHAVSSFRHSVQPYFNKQKGIRGSKSTPFGRI